jgi:glycosyltransferase involved in cell wall biosynthesis
VRVCFLIDELNLAGTESQLVALIRHLDRDRVRPFLALLRPDASQPGPLEPPDCPVLRLGVRVLRRPSTWVTAWRFARFLRRERIDVLQLYTPDSTYFGGLAGWLAGVPQVVRTRNNLNHWMRRRDRWLGRLLNRVVTRTVVNCEAAREAVLRDERPAPESVVILENGVDVKRFWDTDDFNTNCIGVVANLRRVKGIDVFLHAAARLAGQFPDATFLVAGEGEQRQTLLRQIDELGLGDRVELCGRVDDIPAFLATLAVAVLPSRSEGMPNAVLEYMAAARPIVATAVGGTPRLIEDGRHGLLVPSEDPDALAAAVGRLLADRALATRLAAAARRRAVRDFSRRAMVQRFERFYVSLGKGLPCTGS